MTIRRKILLVVVGTSVLAMLAGWTAIHFLTSQGFERLAQERAGHNLGRVTAALDNEAEHMSTALRFKSSSDITYRFAGSLDPSLAANFFSWESLKGARLNMSALLTPTGKVTAGAAFDLRTREALPLAPLLGDLPSIIQDLASAGHPDGRGLVLTPQGPMIICFQPVLNSMGWGPTRGTLVAGRFLDKDLLDKLREQLRLDFTLSPLKDVPREKADQVRGAYRDGGKALFGPTRADTLTATTAYPDYLGTPAVLVEVFHLRADEARFKRSAYLALAFVGVAGAVLFGASYLLLNRAVITPLTRVTGHIEGIKDRRGLGTPLPVAGQDEMGRLAKAFNAMSADLAQLYDKLERQRAMLFAIIDNIPSPIAVKGLDGRYVVANKAHASLFGASVEDFSGKTDLELGLDERQAERERNVEEAARKPGAAVLTPVEPWPDGETARYFASTRLAFETPGGSQLLVVRQDITERLNYERNLKEREHKFRSLFESMIEGVCLHEAVKDASGRVVNYRILDVNPAYERILGITREQAVGRLATEVYNTPSPPFVDLYGRVVLTGAPEVFEVYFKPMAKHFHVSAFSPAVGQFATVFMDTTDEIETRKDLDRARTAIQHILDSMSSPVIGVDEHLMVTEANAPARNLASPDGPLEGRGLGMAFPMIADQAAAVARSVETGEPVTIHKLKVVLGEDPRLVDLQVYPMMAGGKATGAVVRLDDVTERTRMEDVVLQTEKMMSVGGLAAGMAHEINNPLGGILQSVQIIKRRMSAELPANVSKAVELGCSLAAMREYLESREVFKFLDAIQDSGARAARIVSNMLEFSRRSESKMAPCNLTDVVEKALELAANDYDLKKKYDFRRVEIVRDFQDNLPVVRCTLTEMEQVVLNLIKNAAQALAGYEAQKSPRIVISVRREGEMVRLEVHDNGPGMNETVRKRAFEPFFTTKPPGIGTGLGLSVSYFIVTQNHGGDMTLESEPGLGARFIIRLPFLPRPTGPAF